MLIKNLKRELDKKGISLYRLAKLTGIRYELLRRTFNEKRKLRTDEFIKILSTCNLKYEEVKE